MSTPSGNCPLCRAPIKTADARGRYNTCWSGHVTRVESALPGVLPVIPGWICWQTHSNSGISEVRYAFWGEKETAYFKSKGKEEERELGQHLIDQYEDWMNHASHGPRIEWELDCAVPKAVIEEAMERLRDRITNAQQELAVLQTQLVGASA